MGTVDVFAGEFECGTYNKCRSRFTSKSLYSFVCGPTGQTSFSSSSFKNYLMFTYTRLRVNVEFSIITILIQFTGNYVLESQGQCFISNIFYLSYSIHMIISDGFIYVCHASANLVTMIIKQS